MYIVPKSSSVTVRGAIDLVRVILTWELVGEVHVCWEKGGCKKMGVTRKEQMCYVFLTILCLHYGLSLGPSSLLCHPFPSRTDYDSDDSILVHLLVVLVACDSD
jgi:hypothetical protein